ncbi:MAG: RNA 3'-phosphate cyclase [Syntrophaceae bacterium]|nr:RNA 3'-phosphate cyclase [Syntrophaceae bacterium]
MIEIDGSYGEGGGQILRTSLALSAVLRRPVRVHSIRGGRSNPGLQPQHLRGAQALARMTGARTEGLHIGSKTITFIPQEIVPGNHRFEVGTAGSVSLLMQGLLLPLSLAKERSRLTLVGGTHVSWSPPFHYIDQVLFPTLNSMGVSLEATLERWGWYPRGGGIVHVEVEPASELKPVVLIDRGRLKRIRGISASSHLPEHVVRRQRDWAIRRIEAELNLEAEIELIEDAPANSPGSFLFLMAESEKAIAGFSSLGERGKRAEDVAGEAVDSLKRYVQRDGCIDPHLADQLIPFMSIARGCSSFTTTEVTDHLVTNLWVVGHFLDVQISRCGQRGEVGRVDITGSPS